MAFSYAAALTTNRDKVRFYIQDTVASAGPKPDASNFDNAELDAVITLEGSWQRAVAAVFEILAGVWAREVDISVGPRHESLSQTAARYQSLAAEWRAKWGTSRGRGGSRAITRVDGYSSDTASDAV